jgi:cytidine deaminase
MRSWRINVTPEALLEAARVAAANAHAPYSRYPVGAALLCADGTVFTGCNVENASYGLTNCAERTALFAAVAAGQRDFSAMAVVADGGDMPFPCGACRQVLSEFCRDDFPVYIARAAALDDVDAVRLSALLPYRFKRKG